MESLPNLPIQIIAEFLCTNNKEVVLDVFSLLCTCRWMKQYLVPVVIEILDPENDFDRLITKWTGKRPVTVKILKEALDKNKLPKKGKRNDLIKTLGEKFQRDKITGFTFAFLNEMSKISQIKEYEFYIFLQRFEFDSKIEKQIRRHFKSFPLSKRSVLRYIKNNIGDPYKIEEAIIKKKKLLEDQKIEREQNLERALAERGLRIREDSQLCNMYIEGELQKDLEYVVNETEAIAFFYNRTRYPRILRYLRNRRRENSSNNRYYVEDGFYGSDDSYDYNDEEDLRYEAKTQAIKEFRIINKTDHIPIAAQKYLESAL